MNFEDFKYKENESGVVISAYLGNDKNVVIPSRINNKPVTEIGDSVFANCGSLTSIEIPNSITNIGNSAFYHCSSLASITIPSSVMSIGYAAFEDCSSLTSIEIPNSVTSINDLTFLGCCGLTSITIPDSVTSIGDYAFKNCGNLTSITIPDSVTYIDAYAFNSCPKSLVIKCNPGSYAKRWADERDMKTERVMSDLQQLLNRTSSPTFRTDNLNSFFERGDHNEI